MLREAVSNLGMTFFPVAALLIFVTVYASVLIRSFVKHKRPYWNAMSAMALHDDDTTTDHRDASTEGTR